MTSSVHQHLITLTAPLFMHLDLTFWGIVVVSCCLNFWIIHHCRRLSPSSPAGNGWMDIPNNRSSHTQPIPKGGGLGFVLPLGIMVALMGLTDPFPLLILLPGLVISLVGYIDDRRNLTWNFRFVMQTLMACVTVAMVMLWADIYNLPLRHWSTLWQIGFCLISWAGIISLTNITNFMDGIDGIAGIQALIVCVFLTWFARDAGFFFLYATPYFLLAGLIGFIAFNFPKARVFMGDVGSQFLGFTLAVLGICLTATNADYFYVLPLLMMNFFYDTGFTLLRRFLRGENLTQAHRQHLYQLLTSARPSYPSPFHSLPCLPRYPHWFITLVNGGFVAIQGALIILNGFWLQLSGWGSFLLILPVLVLYIPYTLWALGPFLTQKLDRTPK